MPETIFFLDQYEMAALRDGKMVEFTIPGATIRLVGKLPWGGRKPRLSEKPSRRSVKVRVKCSKCRWTQIYGTQAQAASGLKMHTQRAHGGMLTSNQQKNKEMAK